MLQGLLLRDELKYGVGGQDWYGVLGWVQGSDPIPCRVHGPGPPIGKFYSQNLLGKREVPVYRARITHKVDDFFGKSALSKLLHNWVRAWVYLYKLWSGSILILGDT